LSIVTIDDSSTSSMRSVPLAGKDQKAGLAYGKSLFLAASEFCIARILCHTVT